MRKIFITQVLKTSEAKKVIIVLNNKKEIIRNLKSSINDGQMYFVYNKVEYYLNRLNFLNIEIIDF